MTDTTQMKPARRKKQRKLFWWEETNEAIKDAISAVFLSAIDPTDPPDVLSEEERAEARKELDEGIADLRKHVDAFITAAMLRRP